MRENELGIGRKSIRAYRRVRGFLRLFRRLVLASLTDGLRKLSCA